jgi:DNA-binding response OmpR family regulator
MMVLVVEDDHDLIMAYERVLEIRGHKIKWAHTVYGAAELLRTEKDIDLIILDYELGSEMNGLDLQRHIPKGIPVVVTTGYSERCMKEIRGMRNWSVYEKSELHNFSKFFTMLAIAAAKSKEL